MTLSSSLPARPWRVLGAVVAAIATATVTAGPAAAAPPSASVTVVDTADLAAVAAARLQGGWSGDPQIERAIEDRVAALAREAPTDDSTWTWPTAGEVTSEFGPRDHPVHGGVRPHDGIDIGAPTGAPVVAPAPGTVVTAESQGGYGQVVVVDHGDGVETAHAHLSRTDVAVGDTVTAGRALGAVGQTGTATGPHLHLEVRVAGEAVDPRGYFPPAG